MWASLVSITKCTENVSMSYTMLALVLHAARPLINIYMMAIVHDEH